MSAEAILKKICEECYVDNPQHVVDGKWVVKDPFVLIIDGSIQMSKEEAAWLDSFLEIPDFEEEL